MANGGAQGGTLGGVPTGIIISDIVDIVNIIKGAPKQEPIAVNIPGQIIAGRVQQQVVSDRINAAISAGQDPKKKDVKLLAKLIKRTLASEEKLARKIAKSPSVFLKAGFPAGTTVEQMVQIVAQTGFGLALMAKFSGPFGLTAPIFDFQFAQAGGTPLPPPQPLPQPPPQIIRGGSFMSPFSITPSISASPTGDFGGFGGLITEVIRAGGQIGSALLAPRPQASNVAFAQPFPAPQQAGFGALIPAGRAAVGALGRALPSLGGIGAGAIGGELADAAQQFFGAAGSADDTAAFTDAIPGRCRPKMHLRLNPCSGKGTWFVPRGRPLVFSGDLSACKRVDRVAKRLTKSMPRRPHHHHAKR